MKKLIVCLVSLMFLAVAFNASAKCVHWDSYGLCDQWVDDAPTGQDDYYRNNTGENENIWDEPKMDNPWVNDTDRDHWKSDGGVIEK